MRSKRGRIYFFRGTATKINLSPFFEEVVCPHVPQHSDPREFRAARDNGGDSRLGSAVRKVSGANKPSKANEELFHHAVDEVAAAAERLIQGWVTSAPPRDRDVEIRKHIEKSRIRFGREPKRTPIDPIR